jgi:hypothetical protein
MAFALVPAKVVGVSKVIIPTIIRSLQSNFSLVNLFDIVYFNIMWVCQEK